MKTKLPGIFLWFVAMFIGLSAPASALDDELRTPYPSYREFARDPAAMQAIRNAQYLADALGLRSVLNYDLELFDTTASKLLLVANVAAIARKMVPLLPTAARVQIEPPLEGVVAQAMFAALTSDAVALAALEKQVVDVALNTAIALLPQSHNQFYMTLPSPTTKQGSIEWDMPLGTTSQLGIWIVPYHEQRQVFSICDAIFLALNGAQLSGKYKKLGEYLDPVRVAQLSRTAFAQLGPQLAQNATRILGPAAVGLTFFNHDTIARWISSITAGCSRYALYLPSGNYQPVEINDASVVSVSAPPGSPVVLSVKNSKWYATGAAPGMVSIVGRILSPRLATGGTPITFPMAIRVGNQAVSQPGQFPPCPYQGPNGRVYKGLLEYGKCVCIDSDCAN